MSKLREYLLNGGTLDELKEKYLIKYRRHTDYNNLILFTYDIGCPFTEELQLEARGIILDEDDSWNCISRSYQKFFNLGESRAAQIDWNTATVYEKYDGSLITLYKYDGKYHVATTGTPDAKVPVNDFSYTFEQLFYKVLEENNLELPDIPEGISLMFELMTEYNRIVVPHPKMEVVLLNARNARTGDWLDTNLWNNFKHPQKFEFRSIEELLSSFRSFTGVDREGYVIVDANHNRVKAKHPHYVELHHATTGTTFSALVSLALKDEVSETLVYFPHLTDSLNSLKCTIETQCAEIERLFRSIKNLSTRKEFALEATKSRYYNILFKMKDKNITAREVLLAERIPNVIDILQLRDNNLRVNSNGQQVDLSSKEG